MAERKALILECINADASPYSLSPVSGPIHHQSALMFATHAPTKNAKTRNVLLKGYISLLPTDSTIVTSISAKLKWLGKADRVKPV